MIHSCNQRKWYVDNYLVPSLLEQGIDENDVCVYNDTERKGNLKSYIESCHKAYDMWGPDVNVWHLQDDVIISRKFKEEVDLLEENCKLKVVCGFTTRYDDGRNPGEWPTLNHMWYSFPCIRITTTMSKEFANWCDTYLWRDNQFGFWHRHKKGDDYIFRIWIESYYPSERVLNLVPNLVDHIDFLLGGTVVNPQREASGTLVRSLYWDDEDLVNELRERIANDNSDR
jgi:hypothetical protein